jgi:hypothetical protein
MLLRRLLLALAVLMLPACRGPESPSSPRPEAQGQPDDLGVPKGPATSKVR